MENQEVFKPKLRITLLSENGCPVQDRLVDSYTELNSGPKIKHEGPIRLECTLQSKQDIESFKVYLDRLTGTLPLKEPTAGRGRPQSATMELESPREEVLSEVKRLVDEGKNQKDIT